MPKLSLNNRELQAIVAITGIVCVCLVCIWFEEWRALCGLVPVAILVKIVGEGE